MGRKQAAAFFGILLLLAATPEASGKGHDPGARRARPGGAAGRRRSSRPAGRAKDLKGLVSRLRAGGARVGRAGRVSQPFFSVMGRALTVNGEQVQVFEYASARAAEREAGLVGPTGSPVGTSMVSWVAPPHFYRSGRLIVLYVGGDAGLIKALRDVLGPQFAGG